MTKTQEREIEHELEIAELMVKDLLKLWNSYAKKALAAKHERESKQEKKGFLEYETIEDLTEAYAWADIDSDVYDRGCAYFEDLKKPPVQSVIELHRKNIKNLLDNWKGTVKMLQEELNPPDNAPKESVFDYMERQEREERHQNLMLGDLVK